MYILEHSGSVNEMTDFASSVRCSTSICYYEFLFCYNKALKFVEKEIRSSWLCVSEGRSNLYCSVYEKWKRRRVYMYVCMCVLCGCVAVAVSIRMRPALKSKNRNLITVMKVNISLNRMSSKCWDYAFVFLFFHLFALLCKTPLWNETISFVFGPLFAVFQLLYFVCIV